MNDEFQFASARFGDFELNLQSGELYNGDIRIRLPRQSFKILAMLLERPGQVVTRDELCKSLWPADTFVDFKHSVNSAVKRLREALNDTAENPRFIETLPRLGYRYIGPASVRSQPVSQSPETSAPIPLREIPGPANNYPDHTRQVLVHRRWLIPAAMTLAVTIGLAAYTLWPRSRARPQASSTRVMLAVLPFENLTGDANQEYFSDGLTEEMISKLGRRDPQHLGVIARTSVMRYKGSPPSFQQIARELGVQFILEGSVRRNADRVRVSAQLIRLTDQTHLWSREYDREIGDFLDLQSEMAQEIADEIQVALGKDHKHIAVRRKRPASPGAYEAYDLYLRGRYFWNKRTLSGFQQAAEYFQLSITKDPDYAPAYAGLADTFGLMSTWDLVPQNEFMPRARAAALRALQLDESLPEAHASLALIAENYDYDWQTAEEQFRRAIQLDPGYATAHQWYAEYLSWQGRFDEALAESDLARQLDPLSVIIATDHGAILYLSRQYDRAIAQSRAALDMDPGFSRAHSIVVSAYVQQGRFAEALAEIERQRRIHDASFIWAEEAYVYGRWDRTVRAQQALAKLKRLTRDSSPVRTPLLMLAYVGMNRKDQAIALLRKAYVERSNVVTGLKVDPNYDPLRSDPRFQDLLRRIRLAQ